MAKGGHLHSPATLIGGLIGPRTGLDTTEEVKFILFSTKIQIGLPQCQYADSTAPTAGDEITGDVTPERFPIKAMLKCRDWIQAMFSAIYIYIHIYSCKK
jgi:hypothetical protein